MGISGGGAGMGAGSRARAQRRYVELVYARPETTLRKVLHMMASRNIHHVHVMDDDDAPVGVVTPTDILHMLAVEDEDSQWSIAWSEPRLGGHPRPRVQPSPAMAA